MRIQQLKLIRYGKFTDRTLSLPWQGQDIHLIVGPNEAGKSTVRSAISDWLFGIPMRTPLGFVHPLPELRLGGTIERQAVGEVAAQCLAFERTKGNKNTLRTPDDAVLPDATLQSWLGALQVQAFNGMYALDHSTLVEGGAGILSASDDIGRMLFQSAAGIENLGESLKKLQEEAEALWAPRKSGSRAYYQALDAYDSANADFKSATLRTKDWKTQHETLLATAQRLATARQRDAEIRQQLARLERIRRVRPMLLGLDAALLQHTELMAGGQIPLLPDNAAEILSHARQSMVLVGADLQRLQKNIADAHASLAGLQVDRTMLALAEDIQELNERRLQFRAHRTDMVKRAEEIRMEWLRLQELAAGLGWQTDSEDAVRQRLPAAPVRLRLVRLLKERMNAAQQLRTAAKNLTDQQQKMAQAHTALAALSGGVANPALGLAVDQAQKLGDHTAVLADLQAQLERLWHAREVGLAALGAWRTEPPALRAMLVPELALVQGLIDQNRLDAAEAQSLQDMLARKTSDLCSLELALQQLVRDFQPVSKAQVQQARHVRDAAWRAIKLAPQALAERALDFEAHVTEADTLADTRLDRAQYEAERQSKAERVAQQRIDLSATQQRLQSVHARIQARAEAWRALCDACGLPQLPLEMAPSWLQQRKQVLALTDDAAEVGRQQQTQLQAGALAQQALWSLLKTHDAPDEAAPALADCVRRARAHITLTEQAHGERATLERQLQQGESSLAALQTGVGAAQEAWDTWEKSWHAAAQAAGYAVSIHPDQVDSEIDAMLEIDRLLVRIRSIRSERIDTMQADLDGLANAATALAERVAPDLIKQPAENMVMELVKRLDQAMQVNAASTDSQARLQLAHTELLLAQQTQVKIQASLNPLLTAAGVAEVNALGTAIEQSDLRRALERRMDQAKNELTQAADGLSADELRKEVDTVGADELSFEIEKYTQLASAVVQEIADLSTRHGTQRAVFDAFDGTDLAAKAEARRQEAIASMADAAERYVKLHTASRLLRWSMDKFRETKQGPMLSKASALFNTLTGGSFNRLLVDTEAQTPRLFGIRPDAQQVDVTGMSEGTRDQLYLALRLSALALQIEQGLNLPLIADDLFVNFDNSRTAAGLQVLGDLSQKMQVVFLTHHDHLVPLAKEVLGADLNVLRL